MAATTWGPKTRYEPMTWLLANGEIIQEPALETTASGRKVRVAGTTDSVFSSDLEVLLDRAADNIAAERGTSVWIKNPGDFFQGNLNNSGSSKDRALLHLVHPEESNPVTRCWWRFKDPNSCFEVLLVLTLHSRHNVTYQNAAIHFPYREWNASWSNGSAGYGAASDPTDFVALSAKRNEHHDKCWEFARDAEWGWPTLRQNQAFATPRQAVKAMLDFIRDIEDRETLPVPDMSQPHDPKKVDLEVYGSNVSAELVSEITEYLDGAPTVDRALEVYQEFLGVLQAVGIQTGDKKAENDFMAALMTGDKKSLNVQISSLSDEGMRVDGNHRLSLHLPTGTFIVECDHREVDRNQVAEKWEEARTMASLTGEEDVLLGFAKAYAKDNIKKRTENILRERTA